jgi:hypothetical protein
MGPRAFVKRRYSTGGRKQVAYDVMKAGLLAGAGVGAYSWYNRGKTINELEKKLGMIGIGAGFDPYNMNDRKIMQKAGILLQGPAFQGMGTTGDVNKGIFKTKEGDVRYFGRRRRRSTRRKSRKSRKGSKKRKTTRRRKSRKGSKKRKTTRRRKSHKRSRKH